MRRCLLTMAFAAAAAFSFSAPAPDTAVPIPFPPGPSLEEIALPDEAQFPGLVSSERKLEFEVNRYDAPDGKRWIRLRGQYDTAFRAKAEDIVSVLWDFEDSPKVFSRIEESHVRSLSEDGSVAITEQRTGIRVLGFAYLSNLAFRTELSRSGPTTKVESEAVEVDRTTLASRGGWILEEGRDPAGPITYVRYFIDSYVEPKYPAQEWLMRNFGDSDMRKLIRELRAAVAKKG